MMSDIRQHLEVRRRAWAKHVPTAFLIEHGRDCHVGPKTYSGPRGEPKQCYMNATHLALTTDLIYVEGLMTTFGIPIEHAWCVDETFGVIDPTIVGDDGNVREYFGVPFRREYLSRAILWNGCYGLLDYFSADKTAPKLYELGLEAGQQWVIDRKVPRRRRK